MLYHDNSRGPRGRTRLMAMILLPLLLAAGAMADTMPTGDPADLSLKGDQDGTVFRSLTVVGENRVQIRFERPQLDLQIDPKQAPGLELDDALDILDRTRPDMVTPFLLTSVYRPSPYLPRPWLSDFTQGPVARFAPDLADVATWKLQVVDSRGETAMVFAGHDDPPRDLPWDGLRLDGTPAPPGYTYSFVLEARDAAGNERRFVGEGFGLPAYRRDDPAGPEFLFSGAQWQRSRDRRSRASSLLLEAAGWINMRCAPTRPVTVVVTHRSAAEANRLGAAVAGELSPLLGGMAGRVISDIRVETGAPETGTVHLVVGPATNLADRTP